jgi:hypothetical protein
MSDKDLQVLHQAIGRNTALVLSLPSAGMLRNHKSRFLGEVENGILLEAPAGEDALIGELIEKKSPCGVSFRHGVHKVMFAAPIRAVKPGWRLNDSATANAILLDFPAELKVSQKRSDYRVEIVPDSDISIRVWRIGSHAPLKDEPSATKEVTAQIRDLSIGGVGVKFVGKDGNPPVVCTEDRLRVLLSHQGQNLIIEGAMRAPIGTQQSDSIVTGIQFKKLEDDLEGRQMLSALTRMVGQFQREEMRRTKLGLSKSA